MTNLQDLFSVLQPKDLTELLGGSEVAPVMPGTKQWSTWATLQAYNSRKGKTALQFQLTPSEEQEIFTKYGISDFSNLDLINQAIDYMNKAMQEKEMTGTFGADWRKQSQTEMTEQQKTEVATGKPTPVSPEKGTPLAQVNKSVASIGEAGIALQGSQDYVIQPGDTLSALAQKNNTTVEELQRLNPQITDIDKIYEGQSLKLPAGQQIGGKQVSPEIETTLKGIQAKTEQLTTDVATYIAETKNTLLTEPSTNTSLYSYLDDKYDLGSLIQKAFAAPEKTYSQIYADILNNSDYKDILAKATEISDKIKEREDALALEIQEIQDNPFMSEGATQLMIAKATDAANKSLSSLRNEYARLDNLLMDMRETAQSNAEIAIREMGVEQQLDQQKLQFILDRIDEQSKLEIEAGKAPTTKEMGGQWYQWNTETRSFEPMGIKEEKTTKYTDTQRIAEIDRMISDFTKTTYKSMGTYSEEVSKELTAEDYIEMKKKWVIEMGGSSADFNIQYPVGQYLSDSEQTRLKEMLGTSGASSGSSGVPEGMTDEEFLNWLKGE